MRATSLGAKIGCATFPNADTYRLELARVQEECASQRVQIDFARRQNKNRKEKTAGERGIPLLLVAQLQQFGSVMKLQNVPELFCTPISRSFCWKKYRLAQEFLPQY
jgi:hypothetical protein